MKLVQMVQWETFNRVKMLNYLQLSKNDAYIAKWIKITSNMVKPLYKIL